jgi:4-hydroxy-3-methylbut-2-enyl diphosphate reductase IspH
VLHEIVHNRHVVENLNERGALFVESVEDVPPGAMVIFSAHGVSDAVVRRAKERRLQVIDATCPLVKKVHSRARRYGREGLEVIIGHKGHPEMEGTMGCVSGRPHVVSIAAEVGEQSGRLSYLIEDARDIDPVWFRNKHCVGVTAGASAPEVLVEGVVESLQHLVTIRVREMDAASEATFAHGWGTDPFRRPPVETAMESL